MHHIELRACRIALAAALLGGVFLSSAARADGPAGAPIPPIEIGREGAAEGVEGELDRDDMILVTGSRIRRGGFDTIAPIELIDGTDAILSGASSVAKLLQTNTVTSGTGQINDSFIGFASEGGQGANSIGLRGLGARRTLVLLNGRRLAPAGSGPKLAAADLNVLPSNILERVEVLREGASTVYGSDAVAGVVNIITRTRVDGMVVDGFVEQPLGGGGETYRISAIAGATSDRGHITGSVEYRRRHGLRVGDREEFTCPQDGFTDAATGEPVGQLNPGSQELRCFPFQGVFNSFAQNYLLGINIATGATNRFAYRDGDIGDIALVNDHDVRPLSSAQQLEAHVIPPLQSVTAYVNAGYEITPGIETYGEFLFSNRKTERDFVSQIMVIPGQLDTQFFGGTFFGFPLSQLGIATSPFFPESAAEAGVNDLRFFIVPQVQTAAQDVDFYRGNAGLRGELDYRDWRFDLNVQYSKTMARYTNEIIDARNLRAAMDTVIAPSGTPDENVVAALPGQAGAGNSYTCASNLDAAGAFIAGSACLPFNPFDPAVLAGDLPSQVFGYLFADLVGQTTYRQWIAQLVVDGSLFSLPGGDAVFAVGVEYRHDFINDVPSEPQRTGNLYGFPASGITTGSDSVREVFGEVMLPLLADIPFADLLTVNASARLTDYASYGTDVTFHVAGEYAPVPELRLRASYGTSYRAPNLFEQYVAEQTGFSGFDPCNDFASRSISGEALFDNCLSELGGFLNNDIDADGTFDNWLQTGSPQTRRIGGAGNLAAETSTSWNVGTVLRLSGGGVDFSFTADYFKLVVEGEVGTLGPIILDRCYKSGDFRGGNQFCGFVGPRDPDNQGNLTIFDDPFLNIAMQSAEGIDFEARGAARLLGGSFVAQVDVTRMLSQKFQALAEFDPHQFNGSLGNHGATGGPKLIGRLDLRYTTVNDRWLFNYRIDYTGKMDSQDDLAPEPIPFRGTLVTTDLVAESYFKHGFSVQYNWPSVGQITFGVNNLFDTSPPEIGSHGTGVRDRRPTIGNFFNYSTYDFLGRSAFMSVTRSF